MRIGVLLTCFCMFFCSCEVHGSTYSRNLWKSKHYQADQSDHLTIRSQSMKAGQVFEDILKRISLSSITFKNALSKDDIPTESEFLLNIRFSRNF